MVMDHNPLKKIEIFWVHAEISKNKNKKIKFNEKWGYLEFHNTFIQNMNYKWEEA